MSLRRLFVCLIAAAFVFNGAAIRAWADVPVTPSPLTHEHHADSGAGGHEGHAGHGAAVPASDEGAPPLHSNNCLKYCNMCNATGTTPDLGVAGVTGVMFSYAAVVFRLLQGDLTGHPVAVDPHIPKAIV